MVVIGALNITNSYFTTASRFAGDRLGRRKSGQSGSKAGDAEIGGIGKYSLSSGCEFRTERPGNQVNYTSFQRRNYYHIFIRT